jgi:hypothetical protein
MIMMMITNHNTHLIIHNIVEFMFEIKLSEKARTMLYGSILWYMKHGVVDGNNLNHL